MSQENIFYVYTLIIFISPTPGLAGEKAASPTSFVMEIKIKVPDEVAAQAQARGVRVEAYVEEILARQAGGLTPPPLRSSEQIRAWLDSLAQFSDKIPPLPENISREWSYQEQ